MAATVNSKTKHMPTEFLKRTAGMLTGAAGDYISEVMPTSVSIISEASRSMQKVSAYMSQGKRQIANKVRDFKLNNAMKSVFSWYMGVENQFSADDFGGDLEFDGFEDNDEDQSANAQFAQNQITENAKNTNQLATVIAGSAREHVNADIVLASSLESQITAQTSAMSEGFRLVGEKLETLTNVVAKNTAGLIEAIVGTTAEERKQSATNRMLSSGRFNMSDYKEIIKENVNKSPLGMLTAVLPLLGSMKNMITPESVVSTIFASVLDAKAPNVRKNLGALDEALNNVIMGSLVRLGQNRGWRMRDQIARLFGIDSTRNEFGDTEKQKIDIKATPFDTITKEAITNAIPGYLREILKAINGKDVVYDYRSRTFKTQKQINNEFKDQAVNRNTISYASRDLREAFGNGDAYGSMVYDLLMTDLSGKNGNARTQAINKINTKGGLTDYIADIYHRTGAGNLTKEEIDALNGFSEALRSRPMNTVELGNQVAVNSARRNSRMGAAIKEAQDYNVDITDHTSLEGELRRIMNENGMPSSSKSKAKKDIDNGAGLTGINYTNRALWEIYRMLNRGINVFRVGASDTARSKPYEDWANSRKYLVPPAGYKPRGGADVEIQRTMPGERRALADRPDPGQNLLKNAEGEELSTGERIGRWGKSRLGQIGHAIVHGNAQDVKDAIYAAFGDVVEVAGDAAKSSINKFDKHFANISGYIKHKLFGTEYETVGEDGETPVKVKANEKGGLFGFVGDYFKDMFAGTKTKAGNWFKSVAKYFDYDEPDEKGPDGSGKEKKRLRSKIIAASVGAMGGGILGGPIGVLMGAMAGSALSSVHGLGAKIKEMLLGRDKNGKATGAVAKILDNVVDPIKFQIGKTFNHFGDVLKKHVLGPISDIGYAIKLRVTNAIEEHVVSPLKKAGRWLGRTLTAPFRLLGKGVANLFGKLKGLQRDAKGKVTRGAASAVGEGIHGASWLISNFIAPNKEAREKLKERRKARNEQFENERDKRWDNKKEYMKAERERRMKFAGKFKEYTAEEVTAVTTEEVAQKTDEIKENTASVDENISKLADAALQEGSIYTHDTGIHDRLDTIIDILQTGSIGKGGSEATKGMTHQQLLNHEREVQADAESDTFADAALTSAMVLASEGNITSSDERLAGKIISESSKQSSNNHVVKNTLTQLLHGQKERQETATAKEEEKEKDKDDDDEGGSWLDKLGRWFRDFFSDDGFLNGLLDLAGVLGPLAAAIKAFIDSLKGLGEGQDPGDFGTNVVTEMFGTHVKDTMDVFNPFATMYYTDKDGTGNYVANDNLTNAKFDIQFGIPTTQKILNPYYHDMMAGYYENKAQKYADKYGLNDERTIKASEKAEKHRQKGQTELNTTETDVEIDPKTGKPVKQEKKKKKGSDTDADTSSASIADDTTPERGGASRGGGAGRSEMPDTDTDVDTASATISSPDVTPDTSVPSGSTPDVDTTPETGGAGRMETPDVDTASSTISSTDTTPETTTKTVRTPTGHQGSQIVQEQADSLAKGGLIKVASNVTGFLVEKGSHYLLGVDEETAENLGDASESAMSAGLTMSEIIPHKKGKTGLVTKVLEWIKKLFNMLADKFKSVDSLRQFGSKIGSFFDDLYNKTVGSFTEGICEKINNKIAAKTGKSLAGTSAAAATAGLGYVVAGVSGAVSGFCGTEHLFSIMPDKADWIMRTVSTVMQSVFEIAEATPAGIPLAAIEIIDESIFKKVFDKTFKQMIAEFLYAVIYSIGDGTFEEGREHLKELQEGFVADRDYYNQTYGTNLTTQEYNDMVNRTSWWDTMLHGKNQTWVDENGVEHAEWDEAGGQIEHGLIGAVSGGEKKYAHDANGNVLRDSNGVAVTAKDARGNTLKTEDKWGDKVGRAVRTGWQWLTGYDEYETDENGEAIYDENGNPVVKEHHGNLFSRMLGLDKEKEQASPATPGADAAHSEFADMQDSIVSELDSQEKAGAKNADKFKQRSAAMQKLEEDGNIVDLWNTPPEYDENDPASGIWGAGQQVSQIFNSIWAMFRNIGKTAQEEFEKLDMSNIGYYQNTGNTVWDFLSGHVGQATNGYDYYGRAVGGSTDDAAKSVPRKYTAKKTTLPMGGYISGGSEMEHTDKTDETLGTKSHHLAEGGNPLGKVKDDQWTISSGFGERDDFEPPFHYGVDLVMTDGSTPRIQSRFNGTISYVERGADDTDTAKQDSSGNWVYSGTHSGGNMVWIDTDNGMRIKNMHLAHGSIPSKIVPGARVKPGDPIGTMGSTGFSTGKHLHYQMESDLNGNKSAFDPEPSIRADADYGAQPGYSSWSSSSSSSYGSSGETSRDIPDAEVETIDQSNFLSKAIEKLLGAAGSWLSKLTGGLISYNSSSSSSSESSDGENNESGNGSSSIGSSGSSGSITYNGDAARSAEEFLAKCEKEIGMREEPYKSEKTKYNGYSAEPWCMDFVQWCFKNYAPAPLEAVTNGCSSFFGWYEKNAPDKIRYQYGESSGKFPNDPRPGDVVLFHWSTPPNATYPCDHTGILKSIDGNKLVTLEGNTFSEYDSVEDAYVALKNRNMSSVYAIIRGFDWDAYDAQLGYTSTDGATVKGLVNLKGDPANEFLWDYLDMLGYPDEVKAAILGTFMDEAPDGNGAIKSKTVEWDYGTAFANTLGHGDQEAAYENIATDRANTDEYVKKLFNRYQADGTSIIRSTYNADDGHKYPGLGLSGWTGNIGKKLIEFGRSRNKPWYDLGLQAEWLNYTMNDESDPMKKRQWTSKILGSASVDEAVDNFDYYYVGHDVPEDRAQRKDWARKFYEKYKGREPNRIELVSDEEADTSESKSQVHINGGKNPNMNNTYAAAGGITNADDAAASKKAARFGIGGPGNPNLTETQRKQGEKSKKERVKYPSKLVIPKSAKVQGTDPGIIPMGGAIEDGVSTLRSTTYSRPTSRSNSSRTISVSRPTPSTTSRATYSTPRASTIEPTSTPSGTDLTEVVQYLGTVVEYLAAITNAENAGNDLLDAINTKDFQDTGLRNALSSVSTKKNAVGPANPRRSTNKSTSRSVQNIARG